MKTKTNMNDAFTPATKCGLGVALVLILLAATLAHAQLTPSDDAYVNSAAPTTNYGAATTLGLSSAADTAFIRFDLTAVPGGDTGASIAKATLKLYVNSVTTAGSFNVDYVTGTWAEQTIKYNLQPAIGTTIAASVPLATASKGKYVEIDVTAALVEWLNGTQANDGVALVANSPLVATFDSKENTSASHPPELDVVYAGIAGITTASGSGLTGGGSSGTLNLSLLTSCATKQVLQWNGTAWACSSTGTGTITGVTAGTDLTGGGTSGKVTLNLDTTKVPQLSAANTFTGNQSVTGNLSATGSFTGQTASFSVSNSTQVVNVTQSGSGSAIAASSPGNAPAILGSVSTSATGTGIQGQAAGSQGVGVAGFATDTSSGAGAVGVVGSSWAPNGAGVFGHSLDTTNAGVGVLGYSGSPSGFGLYAYETGSLGVGAYGEWQNASSIGAGGGEFGVWGDSSNGTGVFGSSDVQVGVRGYSSSTAGVYGLSNNGQGVEGDGPTGVRGYSNTGIGVLGEFHFRSSIGVGFADMGVWGDTDGGIGVVGTTDGGNALFGKNNTVNHETLYVENDSGFSGGNTPYAARFAGPGASTYCEIIRDSNDNGTGDLVCTGSKSAAVPVDGNRMVRLYAVEAADNWFEDAGSGQLSNGAVVIRFESAFAQTINPSVEYHTFLTPKGDCEGLYVSNEGPEGFEVHELRGGHSNIAFDYRIMARRKGFENVRMQDVTQDFARMKQESDLLAGRQAARKQEEKAHPKMEIPMLPKRAPASSPHGAHTPVLPVRATALPGSGK
jgi:hypothetical protein